MTPKTMEERMATMEAEYGHIKEALQEVIHELKKTNASLRGVPRVVGKKIRRHARECPGNPVATHPPARPPVPPAPDPDWGWVRKALAGLLILGSLIGGAIWGPPRTPDDRPALPAPAASSGQPGGSNP